jgi:hypothetical protein
MREVFFEILSPLPLDSREDARKLFGVWLENAPHFFPDRAGVHEPLRRPFSFASLEDALADWKFQFLLKRVSSPRLQSMIMMQYGPHRLHSTWTLALKSIDDFDRMSFGNLLRAAAQNFFPDFGFIHSITAGETARGLSNGSITFLDSARKEKNLFVTTHILKRYIPDIYWTTIFGRRYVQFFSRSRLLSAPVHSIEELGDGSVVLQLTPELTDILADESHFERLRQAVRVHLGADAFFDPDRGQHHRYQVPQFTWEPRLH